MAYEEIVVTTPLKRKVEVQIKNLGDEVWDTSLFTRAREMCSSRRRCEFHSAMPAVRAERLCPAAIFVAPDFIRYRAVSKSVREIFQRHTDLIEPMSLDEGYLDVTENKTGLPTATLVTRTIREQVRQELSLTASAGVAPNKFLAKLPSPRGI